MMIFRVSQQGIDLQLRHTNSYLLIDASVAQ